MRRGTYSSTDSSKARFWGLFPDVLGEPFWHSTPGSGPAQGGAPAFAFKSGAVAGAPLRSAALPGRGAGGPRSGHARRGRPGRRAAAGRWWPPLPCPRPRGPAEGEGPVPLGPAARPGASLRALPGRRATSCREAGALCSLPAGQSCTGAACEQGRLTGPYSIS